MKVCIVDSRVNDSSMFVESLQDGVMPILLDYENDTFESILAKIGSAESIAYVAHGTFEPTYSFFKDVSFDMLVKESWNPFFDFLRGIKGLQYFDFLGCSLASDDKWKQVFLWMEETGINVRASLDDTGNVVSGGNWILEDGVIDAKQLYFTDAIQAYIGLLVSGSSGLRLAISSNLQYRIKVSVPTLSYSSDYGQTWTALTVPNLTSNATRVAINSTGTVIAYLGIHFNYSSNSGVTWHSIFAHGS